MYTILVLATVGLVIGGYVCRNERVMGLVFGAVIGAVAGYLVALLGSSFVPQREYVYGPAQLVSMRSADGVAGTFMWGSGSIGQSTSYHFMMKLEDGSLTPGSVPADSLVRIIEDDTLHDTGYWRTTYRKNDPASPWYSWTIFHHTRDLIVRQEYRVPVGTVIQQFKVQ